MLPSPKTYVEKKKEKKPVFTHSIIAVSPYWQVLEPSLEDTLENPVEIHNLILLQFEDCK